MRRICASPSQLARVFENLDPDAKQQLIRLLVAFMPDTAVQLEPIRVARILKHAVRAHGLDYYCKFENGTTGFVHDINFCFVPCAETLLANYWRAPRRTISAVQVRFLLSLPQYEFAEGDFLRELLARMSFNARL